MPVNVSIGSKEREIVEKAFREDPSLHRTAVKDAQGQVLHEFVKIDEKIYFYLNERELLRAQAVTPAIKGFDKIKIAVPIKDENTSQVIIGIKAGQTPKIISKEELFLDFVDKLGKKNKITEPEWVVIENEIIKFLDGGEYDLGLERSNEVLHRIFREHRSELSFDKGQGDLEELKGILKPLRKKIASQHARNLNNQALKKANKTEEKRASFRKAAEIKEETIALKHNIESLKKETERYVNSIRSEKAKKPQKIPQEDDLGMKCVGKIYTRLVELEKELANPNKSLKEIKSLKFEVYQLNEKYKEILRVVQFLKFCKENRFSEGSKKWIKVIILAMLEAEKYLKNIESNDIKDTTKEDGFHYFKGMLNQLDSEKSPIAVFRDIAKHYASGRDEKIKDEKEYGIEATNQYWKEQKTANDQEAMKMEGQALRELTQPKAKQKIGEAGSSSLNNEVRRVLSNHRDVIRRAQDHGIIVSSEPIGKIDELQERADSAKGLQQLAEVRNEQRDLEGDIQSLRKNISNKEYVQDLRKVRAKKLRSEVKPLVSDFPKTVKPQSIKTPGIFAWLANVFKKKAESSAPKPYTNSKFNQKKLAELHEKLESIAKSLIREANFELYKKIDFTSSFPTPEEVQKVFKDPNATDSLLGKRNSDGSVTAYDASILSTLPVGKIIREDGIYKGIGVSNRDKLVTDMYAKYKEKMRANDLENPNFKKMLKYEDKINTMDSLRSLIDKALVNLNNITDFKGEDTPFSLESIARDLIEIKKLEKKCLSFSEDFKDGRLDVYNMIIDSSKLINQLIKALPKEVHAALNKEEVDAEKYEKEKQQETASQTEEGLVEAALKNPKAGPPYTPLVTAVYAQQPTLTGQPVTVQQAEPPKGKENPPSKSPQGKKS